jgi:hypothetical protein
MKHFIHSIDVDCCNRIAFYAIKKPIYEADPLHRRKRRIEAGIRQHACNRLPGERAHAIEVDLSLGNPACPPEPLGLSGIASAWGERRLAPNRNGQSVRQCVLRRASFPRFALWTGTRSCIGGWRATGA